jgi:SOS response regulatory protein OraA/RecX
MDSLATEHQLSRQAKTQAYLMQKGFEHDVISKAIKELRSVS